MSQERHTTERFPAGHLYGRGRLALWLLGFVVLAGGCSHTSNRFLTALENLALGQNLGDFHSGFRVYRREVLEKIPFERNSDDFVFDTQFLVQAIRLGYRLGDVPVPVRYFDEASSINFKRSLKYGLSTLGVVSRYWLDRLGVWRSPLFASRA